ncbi:hypothetical protein BDR07DRAFT_567958 [Suillus spraguei]|nr:hypothetical protein BDR07DRAFT_567958 [Suillus spraguei]
MSASLAPPLCKRHSHNAAVQLDDVLFCILGTRTSRSRCGFPSDFLLSICAVIARLCICWICLHCYLAVPRTTSPTPLELLLQCLLYFCVTTLNKSFVRHYQGKVTHSFHALLALQLAHKLSNK